MKRIGSCLLLLAMCCVVPLVAHAYVEQRAAAEALYAEQSYGLALEAYRALAKGDVPQDQARWVAFRLADCAWRAHGDTGDDSVLEQARRDLEAMVRDVVLEEEKDRIWAEVHESLALSYMLQNQRHDPKAMEHAQLALEWWAGAPDIELARQRYLRLFRLLARGPGQPGTWLRFHHGQTQLPRGTLLNVLRIADNDDDRSQAHYLLALQLMHDGAPGMRNRTQAHFEAVLELGARADYYDSALFRFAQWMADSGPVTWDDQGQMQQGPDFPKAVELLRRFLAEFKEGESAYYDDAVEWLEEITGEELLVNVSQVFLPGSEIEYQLEWRNVRQAKLTLYRVDLLNDTDLRKADDWFMYTEAWLDGLEVTPAKQMTSWTHDTKDKGDHQARWELLRLEEKLPVGAYVLEAKGGGESSRQLVLVSEVAVVVKTSGDRALVYLCHAGTGAPLANGRVTLWENYGDGQGRSWRSYQATTDENGLALVTLQDSRKGNYRNLSVFAAHEAHQALSLGNSYSRPERGDDVWRIHAFTDRPAYRPEDTVSWKFVARISRDGAYTTPAGQALQYRITDPRGAMVAEKKVALNDFGAAWDTLDLNADMPLGMYRVEFRDNGRHIGGAELFRLEEYKLPEFQVTVQTPEEDGKKRAFRLGETVEVEIAAAYYFGGPVTQADLEVVVYQTPYYRVWRPAREFPWLHDDAPSAHRWHGGGAVVLREEVKLDAQGKAVVRFETPADDGQDYEYRIEARVTDSSRREITGSESVRVTRQRYYVNLNARHNLHQPGDRVEIDIAAHDANDQPVEVEGRLRVSRQRWVEIWVDPTGRELTGAALDRARAEHVVFPPPPPGPFHPRWREKFGGYVEEEEIAAVNLKTDAQGEATFSFVAVKEGYYVIEWSSPDPGAPPVTSQTRVWVTTSETTVLGYRHGEVQLILDRDTFRAGQTAPLMVVGPTPNRHVLFSVEGETLLHHELIHLSGNVKLIQLPITQRDVPNVYLSAAMVHGHRLHIDTQQVVVPPVAHFLTVDVTADRELYQPREKGTLTVTTRDHEGNPTPAEVALALVDASVFYIQQDLAGDPRPFFFGEKRAHLVRTDSSFSLMPYALLEPETAVAPTPMPGLDHDGDVRLGYFDGLMEEDSDVYKAGIGRAESVGRARSGIREEAETAAMTAPPPPVARAMAFDMASPDAQPGPDVSDIVVRTDFRATAFWQPDVRTGEDGTASVEVTYPDSTTRWNATARAVAAENRFGMGETSARTRMPLQVRLQAPRFFVVGDKVTLSAIVNNDTEDAIDARVTMEALGLTLQGGAERRLTVPAGGEARVDWTALAQQPGTATLKVTIVGGAHGDAMERTYPVHEHGIEKFVARTGKLHGDDATITLPLPAERKAGSSAMTVQVSPSLAVTMLDALPYLLHYPYGCVEQTMSRFLPASVIARTLADLEIDPEDVMGRAFGGIEPEHTDKTQPKGRTSLGELDKVTGEGLQRLYDMQHGNGGWGWWKEGATDPYMTAYVVWGLALARNAGVELREGVLAHASGYLSKQLVTAQEQYDLQAWMLHALAAAQAKQPPATPGAFETKALENLWQNRDRLNHFTLALLALTAHQYGEGEKAQTILRNLVGSARVDRSPDTSVVQRGVQASHEHVTATAHWGRGGIVWRWSDGAVESTAFVLRALLTLDPDHELIEPTMNWLVRNRRGAQWSNTRDTAIVLLALTDYLRTSGELDAAMTYTLTVNGEAVASKTIARGEALSAPSRFEIDPALLRDGDNEIRIVRTDGEGALYFAVYAEYFSLETPIPPAGHEIFVRRQYYKHVGRPTLLKGHVYDKQPLNDRDSLTSGERVEVVLTIEAKNDCEYLVFEDLKPAGLEAVEIRSGGSVQARRITSAGVSRLFGEEDDAAARADATEYTGEQRWVYQELRDRHVALFIDKLPQGVWEIRYDLRAEAPGVFHALPVLGHAMYVPELRCNGAEIRLEVLDRE